MKKPPWIAGQRSLPPSEGGQVFFTEFLADGRCRQPVPDLVRATTLSGTREELVERLRALQAAGYQQFTVQLVHGHEEAALDRWAEVFAAV